jgi:hypothetical protein
MNARLVHHRATLAVLLLAAFSLNAPPTLTPAYAHAGGRAQLYVASVKVEPVDRGWVVRAVLRDLDSGAPEPGFAVQAEGSGPAGVSFGPVALTDPDNDGGYEAALPVTQGEWALTLEANEIPGGNAAEGFRRTWNVVLRSGEALDIAGGGPLSHRTNGGASAVFLLLVLLSIAAVLGVVGAGLARRRGQASVGARPLAGDSNRS